MAHNLALIFTPLLFWFGVRAVRAWRDYSPTGVGDPKEEVKAQPAADLVPSQRRKRVVDKSGAPSTVKDLAAMSRWSERALRKIGRDR